MAGLWTMKASDACQPHSLDVPDDRGRCQGRDRGELTSGGLDGGLHRAGGGSEINRRDRGARVRYLGAGQRPNHCAVGADMTPLNHRQRCDGGEAQVARASQGGPRVTIAVGYRGSHRMDYSRGWGERKEAPVGSWKEPAGASISLSRSGAR
jgi:hypothetical protein